MELKNYSKHVLPVAEYFDQLKKLSVVDGERQPPEVYQDFLKQVDSVLNDPKGGSDAPFRPSQQNDKLIRNAPVPVPSMPVKAPVKSKNDPQADTRKNTPIRLLVIWVIGRCKVLILRRGKKHHLMKVLIIINLV